jgi:hypothetical protein
MRHVSKRTRLMRSRLRESREASHLDTNQLYQSDNNQISIDDARLTVNDYEGDAMLIASVHTNLGG